MCFLPVYPFILSFLIRLTKYNTRLSCSSIRAMISGYLVRLTLMLNWRKWFLIYSFLYCRKDWYVVCFIAGPCASWINPSSVIWYFLFVFFIINPALSVMPRVARRAPILCGNPYRSTMRYRKLRWSEDLTSFYLQSYDNNLCFQ